jgi:hypothetical protein
MKETLRKAVENESEKELISWLSLEKINKINSSYYEIIEKALVGNWHSAHEDLVNTIYLANLKDDRFVQPILNIALNKEYFRRFDDELESTLRKCVHALKTINSIKSIDAIERLERLNNGNVKITLGMYMDKNGAEKI